MDIQEAREAFERRQAKVLNVPYEGLKAHLDENSRLFGARYNTGSINEKEWNLWLEAWQAKAQAVPENKQFNLNEFLTMEEKLKHKGGVIEADLDRFTAYAEMVLEKAKALKEPK